MTATAPLRGPRPGPTPVRRPLGASALLATLTGLFLGLMLACAAPASAHAALTGSDPRDGAVVDTAPRSITLSFSESVSLSDDAIRVLDPTGERADTGGPRSTGAGGAARYAVTLHSGLPDGTYTVAWQAVSADSHPVSGAFTFSIGAPSTTTVTLPASTAGGGLVGALYGIARYAAYTGFILLAGGSAFVLACWRGGASVRPLQRLVVGGWITLTASTLAMLMLRNPYTGSGKLSDAFDPGGLQAVLDTKPGAALISRLLLLGASALFVAVLFGTYPQREDETERKDLTFGLALGGAVVATGIAGTWSLAEHASTGLQPGIAMPVDMAHLLAVAAWLGGLAALLTALYRVPELPAGAVRRFSRVAFVCVVVLAGTGLYQSWRQVGSWSALTGTTYGRLLLVKVGLVAVLVGVAWISRRWTGRLTVGGPPATDPAADVPVEGDDPPAEPASEEPVRPSASVTEEPVRVCAPVAEGPVHTSVSVAGAGTHPERAAQLARQQALMTAAKVKRARDADPGRTGLRRSVLVETGVAVVLLAVTTLLSSTEPGRTEEEAARTNTAAAPAPAQPVTVSLPFDTGGRAGKGTVQVDVDPGRTGSNDMHLWLQDAGGTAMDVPEVRMALTLEAKDIGPLPVLPDRLAEGHWTASDVQIPMAGRWKLAVTVRTSDIDQTTVDGYVKIG
ncbi:copper resistance protein CopC [Streptomyces sp. NBC_01218]|uniref:copper resistance CopC/CopD family protein n=1 Tax=Streptomyces sp. NBC_01218 TaxID=2903780 RepID=UPI002E0F85B1|nr:copper resistance protein CopC [Streptomyces sp. NBC_01218]